jgi:hypothetical protein
LSKTTFHLLRPRRTGIDASDAAGLPAGFQWPSGSRASLTAAGPLEWRVLSDRATMRLLLRVLFVLAVFLAVAWAEWNGFF